MNEPDPAATTTDADGGVPSWPRWRVLYAFWQSAADWQTKGMLLRGAMRQAWARARRR